MRKEKTAKERQKNKDKNAKNEKKLRKKTRKSRGILQNIQCKKRTMEIIMKKVQLIESNRIESN